MKPQLIVAFAFVVTSALLSAQEWSRDQAVREITELTTTRFPREQWPERNARMMAWLERVEKTKIDLGDYAFTKAIPLYLNGHRDRAGEELFGSLSKQPTLPTDKFNEHVGRILMAYAWGAVQDDNLDLARKVVPLALRLSSDPTRVYRVMASSLMRDPTKKANTRYLNELLAAMLADSGLSDSAKQELLAALYGTRGRSGARDRSAGGRVAAARVRGRASTIQPFRAKSIDGEGIDIRDLTGKVVLVDFWATWCAPCIRKMPTIVGVHSKLKDRGLVVIGVSLDREPGQKRGGELVPPDPAGETMKKVRATMKKLGMDWPVVYEGGGWDTRLAKENGIRAIPATFLIDRKGKVRYSNLGDDLEQRVQELLDEGQQQRRF